MLATDLTVGGGLIGLLVIVALILLIIYLLRRA